MKKIMFTRDLALKILAEPAHSQYNYIAQDRSGMIYLYMTKPKRDEKNQWWESPVEDPLKYHDKLDFHAPVNFEDLCFSAKDEYEI